MLKQAVSMEIKNKIAIVTINRPEKRNAVNDEVLEGLVTAAEEIKNSNARAVIITGFSRI